MSSLPADFPTPSANRIVHQVFVPFQLPDPATPSGVSIARRLQNDLFLWLTTVDEAGVPQPLAVAFLWDAESATFLTYSLPESERGRLAHMRQHPSVALHFEGCGGDYLIITGVAVVCPDDPPADQVPAWVAKYQEVYPRLVGMTLQQAARGTIPVRIRPLTLRYIANPSQVTS